MTTEQAKQEQAESVNLADAELEEVAGGGTGSNSVIRKNGRGYSRAKLS